MTFPWLMAAPRPTRGRVGGGGQNCDGPEGRPSLRPLRFADNRSGNEGSKRCIAPSLSIQPTLAHLGPELHVMTIPQVYKLILTGENRG